ncbi:isoprenyl transferase [Marivibrio halodurans]|uniref:Isoprenyl transferase n=1 Tax=Marivibrio halodurans TaxID=2039722 RepID=A0A8J7SG21_9PROT|nr:isoprenyl transferase [Marivibrio halodurans]MBP5855458.1 isoprenyl transferase [Marivibrio halodurans]
MSDSASAEGGRTAPSGPRHVAIIMDGNGRWARRRGLPRAAGHRKGVEAVRAAIEGAADAGIEVLTLYSFSAENWRRPADEIETLMGLLRRYLQAELADMHARGIRFRAIGERDRLPADIVKLIDEAEQTTEENDKLTLVLALNYGGRQDIARAARNIAESVARGLLSPEAVDDDLFSSYLLTAGLPDPDLLIRTSGEQRISNFLLWQMAYTEFIFIDKYWPDFTKEDFAEAVDAFTVRDRRYGSIKSGR